METEKIEQAAWETRENAETQQLLAKIIQKGYQRAATSFSTMIGTKVTLHNKQIDTITGSEGITGKLAERQNVTMIVTSIIGALRGESYLLLTANEEQVICEMCRKAFGGGNSVGNEMVLKEIDNIISAAVITEFSNVLSLRIYGDVPHLYRLDDPASAHRAQKFDEPEGDCFIVANASFGFPAQASVTPSFIWRFENNLLNLVEQNKSKILAL